MRKNLLKTIRELLFGYYNSCYTEMQYFGHAAFGNCSGLVEETKNTKHSSYECINCPFLYKPINF